MPDMRVCEGHGAVATVHVGLRSLLSRARERHKPTPGRKIRCAVGAGVRVGGDYSQLWERRSDSVLIN